ncbi:hypothetical protein LXL04_006615 [Taraxacum kok-saghyz]
MTSDALLKCFLSGLRDDIQNEIALHKPTTFHQAYGLVKHVEDKLRAHLPSSDDSVESSPTNPPLLPTPTPPPPTTSDQKVNPHRDAKTACRRNLLQLSRKIPTGPPMQPSKILASVVGE